MKSLKEYLQDPNTFATSLIAIVLDTYGAEALNWDPATLQMEISDDFGVTLTGPQNDKLQAAITILTSDLFFQNLETFCAICDLLNGGVMDKNTFIPADLDDILWGCTEANLLLGKEYNTNKFNINIETYVGFLLERIGAYTPPDMLDFATYPSPKDDFIQENLGNDPMMYQVFVSQQETLKNDLELDAQDRLNKLLEEMKELPLSNKNVEVINRLLAAGSE